MSSLVPSKVHIPNVTIAPIVIRPFPVGYHPSLQAKSFYSVLFIALAVFVVYWMNSQRWERNLPLGPKKYPLIGSLHQCPPLSNERRLRSGDKTTVRDGLRPWFFASNVLLRFRYSSCERFREINCYLKLVQSCHQTSRPKIQYLLQQVSWFKYSFNKWITEFFFLLQLDRTLPWSTDCEFFVSYFEDYINDMIIALAGASPSLRFPTGMFGDQVDGYSQNTLILPTSINRTK